MNFHNPRLRAEIPDWPMGGSRRATCTFAVEHKPGKGWRFTKQTTGKPKTTTYAGKGCIVDGDDGKTYLLQHAGQFDFITIRSSDLLCADPSVLGHDHTTQHGEEDRFNTLMDLIEEAYADGNTH